MNTTELSIVDNMIHWPKEIPNDAYYIIYLHSEMKVGTCQEPIDSTLLYEAWAFNGRISWHIWKRDDKWVCTTYDTREIEEQQTIITKQILAESIRNELRKNQIEKQYLVIHESIEFDSDHQAYIAYSCPIDFE